MTRFEIYGIVLIALTCIVAGAYFKGHHAGYTEALDKVEAASLKAEQAQRDKLLEVSTTYEKAIAQIKVDSAKQPVRVVRLCNAPVQNAATTGESQSTPTDRPNRDDGIDIGPRLREYAERAKACAIQVNSLLDSWPR